MNNLHFVHKYVSFIGSGPKSIQNVTFVKIVIFFNLFPAVSWGQIISSISQSIRTSHCKTRGGGTIVIRFSVFKMLLWTTNKNYFSKSPSKVFH